LEEGCDVTVLSTERMLSTTEAAEFLNMSRPHLIKQVEGGVIPAIRVGGHRRIRVADLILYREQRRAKSKAALARIRQEAAQDEPDDLRSFQMKQAPGVEPPDQ
jgi:excisionase family DNA binding protein